MEKEAQEAIAGAQPSNALTGSVAAPKKRRPQAKTAPLPEHRDGMDLSLLFEKYSYDVAVSDQSIKSYVSLRPAAYPASYRRTSDKKFSKANINIIERLENALMRGGTGKKIGGHVIRTKGRLQGKKLKVMHIIEKAFDAVHAQTGSNPVQVFINALENSAPIEDTTRIRQGGTISNIPVDISASRRLDTALRNIATAAIIGAFSNKRSISQALANELILASKNDVNSYAIKRKNEIERMARSAK
ncbi:30S ribosomal protein S7 [Candidatus Marsarchaeota archaeon]|nr:30S ribosomal protein S7 [Candidatus Marsarchaeota archaeon]MCL5099581.1 30S ribosomal protein S7 [Candidatus Marsarchaeota archaeon]